MHLYSRRPNIDHNNKFTISVYFSKILGIVTTFWAASSVDIFRNINQWEIPEKLFLFISSGLIAFLFGAAIYKAVSYAFNNVVYKWKVARKFFGVDKFHIEGQWRCQLRFENKENTDGFLLIKQTGDMISIRLVTKETVSFSTLANISSENTQCNVWYTYNCLKFRPDNFDDTNHDGASLINFSKNNDQWVPVNGIYFNKLSQNQRGVMIFFAEEKDWLPLVELRRENIFMRIRSLF